ncbi:histamine N-methyltransferase-like isoform X1 [Brachionichthys hirsutus]|uniref:histamine N-methyltransferase-like isoform X1 n=1 Tax=Brachionichthys hirsutus TaxID=412623 RepID=UPI00360513B0
MESPKSKLPNDSERYLECFRHFLKHSTQNQVMQDFIDHLLPDIMKIGNGTSNLNVIGVGSGCGDIDLKILSALHHKYPEMTVDNEVIEPNPQQLRDYRDLVSQTPGLDYVTFIWNEMTAEEFEEQWKENKRTKKADLIHMFQMMYFVKDPEATVSFFQSLLNKNGRLLITLYSGNIGWVKMLDAFSNQLGTAELNRSTDDIKRFLDSKGVRYQSHNLPAKVDITKCFIEGDEDGELMLDFLTQVLHFSKTASPELKAKILEFLHCPEVSVESNGKVLMNADSELIVLEQLT